MKQALTILLVALTALSAVAQQSPLAKYSAQWNDPKYRVCNTAKNTAYLGAEEKQIIYILNLARMNPQLFCKTVLTRAKEINGTDTSSDYYYKSLVKMMAAMQSLNILNPDTAAYQSAMCHATTSGAMGYTGHERQTEECRKKKHFFGECCMYGSYTALDIVIFLLVDDGVQSLGHRKICLGQYTKMSPSFAAHKSFGHVAVLDFI